MLKRQKDLLKHLEKKKTWQTATSLSKCFNVSTRTIRSDISTINNYYKHKVIISSNKFGYCFNSETSLSMNNSNMIPQNNDDRIVYILKSLIVSNKINIIDLQDEIALSIDSIKNIIKSLRDYLEPYNSLKIILNHNEIILEGKEYDKRLLYKELLKKEIDNNFINLNTIASLFNNFDLLEVKNIIDNVFKKYNYYIHEMALPLFLFHLGISLDRILQGNMTTKLNKTQKINECLEYHIALDYYHTISKKYFITINDSEIILLALLLLGKKRTPYYKHKIDRLQSLIINNIVEEMLEEMFNVFKIDLRNDLDLNNSLITHIYSLLDRKDNKSTIKNSLLEQIKRNYPLVFDMGLKASRYLNLKLLIPIDENEAGFIALHLAAAIDRMERLNKYKVLLISSHNETINNQIIDKINNHFSDKIEIVKVSSYYEDSYLKEYDINLIISLIKVDNKIKLPFLKISMFFSNIDHANLLQLINELDYHLFKNNLEKKIINLMNPKYFINDIDFKSKEEVIDYVCDMLLKDGIVTKEYKRSLLKREELSSTSFSYMFATPHALNDYVISSTIPIIILKSPIVWKDYDVRLIFFLTLKQEDTYLTKALFDWLNYRTNNFEDIMLLFDVDNYEEFITN